MPILCTEVTAIPGRIFVRPNGSPQVNISRCTPHNACVTLSNHASGGGPQNCLSITSTDPVSHHMAPLNVALNQLTPTPLVAKLINRKILGFESLLPPFWRYLLTLLKKSCQLNRVDVLKDLAVAVALRQPPHTKPAG
jgi:hypothetical protein